MLFSQEKRKIVELELDKIAPNPSQPRREFSAKELDELAESIVQNGLLQPLTVRKTQTGYELIAGERRLRACKKAGMRAAPCIITSCNEQQSAVYAMLENIQRENLKLFEEAEGLRHLIEKWGVTQEEAAKRLGKSQSALANKLRLLRLSESEREQICKAGLTERHARALLRISNEKMRDKVLAHIIKEQLNVQQTDQLIDAMLQKEDGKKAKRTVIVKDVRIFINTIRHAIETMRNVGINAVTEQRETEDYIECIVKIPKDQAVQKEKKPA